MSYAIQVCTVCGILERGHTGAGDHYVCVECSKRRGVEGEARILGGVSSKESWYE